MVINDIAPLRNTNKNRMNNNHKGHNYPLHLACHAIHQQNQWYLSVQRTSVWRWVQGHFSADTHKCRRWFSGSWLKSFNGAVFEPGVNGNKISLTKVVILLGLHRCAGMKRRRWQFHCGGWTPNGAGISLFFCRCRDRCGVRTPVVKPVCHRDKCDLKSLWGKKRLIYESYIGHTGPEKWFFFSLTSCPAVLFCRLAIYLCVIFPYRNL